MAISDVQEYTHLSDEEVEQLGRELDDVVLIAHSILVQSS